MQFKPFSPLFQYTCATDAIQDGGQMVLHSDGDEDGDLDLEETDEALEGDVKKKRGGAPT